MSGRILALIDDMFFATKVETVARQLGLTCRILSAHKDILSAAQDERPGLVIVDLNAASGSALDLIRVCRKDPVLQTVKIVGFLSHVQTDLHQEALAAGCHQVLPRSTFSRELPQILKATPRE